MIIIKYYQCLSKSSEHISKMIGSYRMNTGYNTGSVFFSLMQFENNKPLPAFIRILRLTGLSFRTAIEHEFPKDLEYTIT